MGIVLVCGALGLGVTSPAVAGPYGPHTGDATVSKTRVVQGQTVRVGGDSFCPNTPVKVTVAQGGDTYIRKTIQSDRHGDASTTVRLTEVGRDTITLSGCYDRGGRQVLSATVRVVPHHGHKLRVSDSSVNKGDRVQVSGTNFCDNSRVNVKVYDDGRLYKENTIRADRRGDAETSIRLTRAGETTITFTGCDEEGGRLIESATVRVRDRHSFRSAPVAYAGEMAGRVPPAGYAGTGLALVLLLAFGANHLMFARRRRSS
jgi:hypothetical protein